MIGYKLLISKNRVLSKRSANTFEEDCQLIYHLECLIDYLCTLEMEDSFDIMQLGANVECEKMKDDIDSLPTLDRSKENVRLSMFIMGKHLAELKNQHSKFDLQENDHQN